MNPIKEFLKKIAFRYFKLGIPTYRYNIEPIQLACLINEIERLKDIDASILLYNNKFYSQSYFYFQQASEKGNKAFWLLKS